MVIIVWWSPLKTWSLELLSCPLSIFSIGYGLGPSQAIFVFRIRSPKNGQLKSALPPQVTANRQLLGFGVTLIGIASWSDLVQKVVLRFFVGVSWCVLVKWQMQTSTVHQKQLHPRTGWGYLKLAEQSAKEDNKDLREVDVGMPSSGKWRWNRDPTKCI